MTALFVSISILAYAQSSDVHLVKRGETFASIAAKYGMTENELKQANPNVKTCYAGMKLNVKSKTAAPAAKPSAGQNPRPAAVQSTSTTPNPDKLASLTASAKTALNYFKMQEWSKCISLLKKVKKDVDCPVELQNLCDEIIAKAKEFRSEKRATFWGNLAEGFGRVGDALFEASARRKCCCLSNFTSNRVYQYNAKYYFCK